MALTFGPNPESPTGFRPDTPPCQRRLPHRERLWGPRYARWRAQTTSCQTAASIPAGGGRSGADTQQGLPHLAERALCRPGAGDNCSRPKSNDARGESGACASRATSCHQRGGATAGAGDAAAGECRVAANSGEPRATRTRRPGRRRCRRAPLACARGGIKALPRAGAGNGRPLNRGRAADQSTAACCRQRAKASAGPFFFPHPGSRTGGGASRTPAPLSYASASAASLVAGERSRSAFRCRLLLRGRAERATACR